MKAETRLWLGVGREWERAANEGRGVAFGPLIGLCRSIEFEARSVRTEDKAYQRLQALYPLNTPAQFIPWWWPFTPEGAMLRATACYFLAAMAEEEDA